MRSLRRRTASAQTLPECVVVTISIGADRAGPPPSVCDAGSRQTHLNEMKRRAHRSFLSLRPSPRLRPRAGAQSRYFRHTTDLSPPNCPAIITLEVRMRFLALPVFGRLVAGPAVIAMVKNDVVLVVFSAVTDGRNGRRPTGNGARRRDARHFCNSASIRNGRLNSKEFVSASP